MPLDLKNCFKSRFNRRRCWNSVHLPPRCAADPPGSGPGANLVQSTCPGRAHTWAGTHPAWNRAVFRLVYGLMTCYTVTSVEFVLLLRNALCLFLHLKLSLLLFTVKLLNTITGTSWCAKQVLTQDVWPWLTKRKPTTPELLVLNAFAG